VAGWFCAVESPGKSARTLQKIIIRRRKASRGDI
jgi:hypothetical protein